MAAAAAAVPREPSPSTRKLIWEHAKDVAFLLVCELALALCLAAIGSLFPELQPMVAAVQPILEYSVVATIGSLALETLARMFVMLWIELASRLRRAKKEDQT